MNASRGAPLILAAAFGALALSGVVGRSPGTWQEPAATPAGPPPVWITHGAEALEPGTLPEVEPGAWLEVPERELSPALASLEFVALLPDGLAAPPLDLEYLHLESLEAAGRLAPGAWATGVVDQESFWAQATYSSQRSSTFVVDDLEPGRYVFRLRGRGTSTEVFGPFTLAGGECPTLEAALWYGGALEVRLEAAPDQESSTLTSATSNFDFSNSGWSGELYQGEHMMASPRAPRHPSETEPGVVLFERLAPGWHTPVLTSPTGERFELEPVEVQGFGSPTVLNWSPQADLPPVDPDAQPMMQAQAMGSSDPEPIDR